MTIDRAHVQRWLDRYVEAWTSYDEAEIADLFSADAEYRYHPWDDDPVVGREAIVHDWLNPAGSAANRDAAGTIEGHYEAWVTDGSRAVAIGESIYYADATKATEVRRYWNNWLLEFDADGRCRSFVEYYMQRKRT